MKANELSQLILRDVGGCCETWAMALADTTAALDMDDVDTEVVG